MDISFSNVLEGARQYFQGLPSPASSSSSQQAPQGGSSVNEPASTNNSPRYSNPDSAPVGSTPPHYDNVVHRPSSQQTASAPPPPHQQTVASSASSTGLSYWPPQTTTNSVYQRTKDVSAPGPSPSQVQQHLYVPSKIPSGSSTAQNASHTVYNGSRLNVSEARTMNYQHQNHLQQQSPQQQQQQSRPQGHNLPPIAALPNYHSSRSSRDSSHRLSQHQQHITAATLQAQQISSKIAVSNSSLLRTQSEYSTQTLQNQQNHGSQYTGANSGSAVGSVSTGTIQYGIHRSQKYPQQIGSAPASYSNYTSPQPQQVAATSISSSSSASASSSVYQSSLHHSQQPQQQYAYHLPHHTQGSSSHSAQPEIHMKPEHSSKRQYPSHQNYYNPSATGRPQPSAVPSLSTNILTNGHQRSLPPTSSTASAIRNGRNKRESPLDLSVKTVRQSADSTAKDDMESTYSITSYSPASVEHQSRGKTGVAAIRSRTPQQTPVLPPLQLPSSVAYPTFDTRGRPSSSNTPASAVATAATPSVGAPKVDFLPNFGSASQHSSTAANNCVTDNQRPSGRTNPMHHQLYSQSSGTTLPHVGSFRKSSSATLNTIPGSYEQKQAPYYAATPISQTQHRHSNVNSSSASTMLPPYSTSSSNHYPSGYEKRMPDPMQSYGTNRLDFQNRGSSQNSAAYMTSSATIGQKRGSSETRHPSPAKVPRLDKWKQTMDQQIEQRFSSYTSSRAQQQQQQQQQHQQQQQQQLQPSQQQVNGNLESSRHETQYSHLSVMHHQSQQPNLQHHPRATAPAAVTATNQPQHGYPQTMPYVPNHGHQQYQTAHVGSQPMTQQQPPPRSHALQRLLTNPGVLQSQQSLNRTITAATAGGMADKRVLSILRNSLEIKEARMTELQNQLQQNRLQHQQNTLQHHHQHQQQQQQPQQVIQVHQQNQQAGNQYHQIGQQTNHQQSPMSESPIQILTTHRKPSQLTGRHNLPSFPMTMDPNAQIQTQVPPHKIHVPKAVESVSFDTEAESVTPRVPSAQNIGRTEVPETNHGSIPVNNSNSNSGDPDGFAAILAARIRTKAELKQVGPSLEQLSNSQQQQFRCPTPASSIVSASNSSVHSPRTTPGTPVVFSPPPHPMQTIVDVGESILSPIINESTKVTERTPPSHIGMQQNQSAQSGSGASSSGGSPPKLTRERVPFPPRRRLFSRPDEEPGGTNGGGVIAGGSGSLVPPRDSSGLRSSSETSVFDFRDSDSEGEMPVLEMQTLDEMRRDRKSHTKNQAQASSTSVPEMIELAEDVLADTTTTTTTTATITTINTTTTTALEATEAVETRPVSPFDPFFSDTCDKFLEQLRTGSLKRKVRRKKTVAELKAIPDKVDNRSESIEVKVEHIEENEKKIEKIDQIKVEKIEEKEDEKIDERKVEKIVIKKPEKSEEKNSGKNEQVAEKIIEKDDNKNKIEKKKVDKCINKENDKCMNKQNDKIVNKEKKTKLDDSDEDVPLIRRRGRPRKKDIDADVEDEISLAEIKARLGRAEKSAPTEVPKTTRSRSSSSSSNTSSVISSEEEDGDDDDSDSHEETVAERLRRRKRQGKDDAGSIGMRLRSKTPSTPQKASSNEKEKTESPGKSGSKKKKPQFGDGSDFRPGWEEEVYRFKRSLRMPDRLINIPRPPHTHRLSASLPDLDPYPNSPAASTVDSSDFSPQRRNLSRPGGSLDRRHGAWSSVRSDLIDSDLDSSSNLSAPLNHGLRTDELIVDSEEATSSTTLSTKLKSNDNNNSILKLLVSKYSKSSRKKSLEKNLFAGRSGSRTIPRSSDGPELLATPSLGIGLKKSPNGKADNKKSNLHKKKKNKKGMKDNKDALCDIEDSVYLGYFRKKTVTNFRDAFLQNGGILAQNFAPIVYKSRTRTQTRVLRKRATIREVFGEDRPASAPPICQEEREIELTEKKEVKEKLVKEESGPVGRTRNNSNTGGRPGLRSAGLRRSNKALLNSKRRLLRRDHDLMRNLASKKVSGSQDDKKESNEPVVLLPQISRESSVTKTSTTTSSPPSSTSQQMEDGMVPPNGKRIKLRSVRRKFRSGFDYIRKKKKQQKKEGESEGPKDKKKNTFPRPSSESVQDIQAEIRGWVINKGLGETLLHRAARLGYTDVAAYCLEKLDNPPSPRDNAGYTPLHEACSRGHLEIARLLLMYGANVSDSALGGIRPLHEAAENGFTELIRLLLSYGADPLLATYSGCTPLSLASDDEARRLLQHHLADVQGLPAPPWTFQGPASCCDPPENGYDPLLDPPSPSPEPAEDFEVEIESSELALPVLYRLRCEPPGDRWVLLQDLTQVLRIKSRDALLRQLSAEAKSVMRELKMADFLEQARSCHLACGGEKINVRASKVALVRYNEKVRQLLGVEKVTIGGR